MTPNEERSLYLRDHFAWCKYMAPRWRDMAKGYTDAQKRELWAKASPTLREALNRLKRDER